MTRVHSFPPIAAPDARRLLLGSMPGIASLTAQQYYAHPQNVFWKVLTAALDINAALSYEERCRQLMERRIAVWDVLKTCTRTGSLDSDILADSVAPNDFAGFFAKHPHIELICFNGAKAEDIWRRHIAPTLPQAVTAIRTVRLPSTSPAHASLALAEKITRWHQALNPSQTQEIP